jgi:hypothetical protein
MLKGGIANMVTFLWSMGTNTHVLVNQEEQDLLEFGVEGLETLLRNMGANLAMHKGFARGGFRKGFANVVQETELEGDSGADVVLVGVVRTKETAA